MWIDALSQPKMCIRLCLDQILIYKLSMYGFRDNELNWFRDYFTDRQQCVKISGVTSDYRPVSRGVP